MKKDIQLHKIDISTSLPLKYADEGIRAGFPSPAQDYLEQAIDLNKELIKPAHSTVVLLVTRCVMKVSKRETFLS